MSHGGNERLYRHAGASREAQREPSHCLVGGPVPRLLFPSLLAKCIIGGRPRVNTEDRVKFYESGTIV